jgi:anti-sigma factor RsiW
MVLGNDDCLTRVMAVRGVLGANLVDLSSGLSVGSVGRTPNDDHRLTAAGVQAVVEAAWSTTVFVGVGEPGNLDDIVVNADNGYHLIHFVPGRPHAQVAIYAWLDRAQGNLAMAQRHLRSTAREFVAG